LPASSGPHQARTGRRRSRRPFAVAPDIELPDLYLLHSKLEHALTALGHTRTLRGPLSSKAEGGAKSAARGGAGLA
jgi:hypothetical protein